MPSADSRLLSNIRLTQKGLLINAGLVVVKLVAGIVGHSGALVADGVESTADIFSSIIVWKGLKVAGRSADDAYHFGYGKAESVAAAVVSLMLLGAAIGIAIVSIREILTPHLLPAPWTLGVLAVVIVVKEILYRRVVRAGRESGSLVVTADAWHHRADAITSAAAFIGIGIATVGGPGWEPADDYAALLAAAIIAINGINMLRPAIADLMDRAPEGEMLVQVGKIAMGVEDVRAIEKLKARKTGTGYLLDMHVQADAGMSLHDAHILSGKVKSAIRREIPSVAGVLIHMEPHEPEVSWSDPPAAATGSSPGP